FARAVSSIPGIVHRYMDQRMNEAVKVAIQLQSDRLRDEAQKENDKFLKTIDENMQKIIKEQVKEQVKSDRLCDEAQKENDKFLKTIDENMQKIIKEQAKEQVKVQVSKILPKIEQTVNEQLEAKVLTRSSNSSKTSYSVAADYSQMELKKILIKEMEGNNTHKVAKDLWERIQMLMQGTSLTNQERECKLYDVFDKFAYQKGETLRDLYLRFSLLLNDMNMYNMKLEQFQVNTKFLNTLPPEWSKFVTDVKLVRDLHTTNVDQLHAYLGQHEYHANEVRLIHERHSDPLALISQHQLNRPTYQHHQQSYHKP
nr:hypothetical protein [Tanacetum cinerariifolium]